MAWCEASKQDDDVETSQGHHGGFAFPKKARSLCDRHDLLRHRDAESRQSMVDSHRQTIVRGPVLMGCCLRKETSADVISRTKTCSQTFHKPPSTDRVAVLLNTVQATTRCMHTGWVDTPLPALPHSAVSMLVCVLLTAAQEALLPEHPVAINGYTAAIQCYHTYVTPLLNIM